MLLDFLETQKMETIILLSLRLCVTVEDVRPPCKQHAI